MNPIAPLAALAATLVPAAAFHPSVSAPDPQPRQEEVAERFEQLVAAGDHAGLVALLRDARFSTLPLIDAYLERSLAQVESGDEPDLGAIAVLHGKALAGARAADEAFGRAIFSDYACAFIGWSREQQLSFRAGQQAFGEGRKAMAKEKYAMAAEHARECIELAEPLGDWWGTAMGLGLLGSALHAEGQHEAALVPLSRARLINHQLLLGSSEYKNTQQLARSLLAVRRAPRALATAKAAVRLGAELGDEKGRPAVLELWLQAAAAVGDGAEVAAAEAALAAYAEGDE